MAETVHAANRGEKITTIFINNAIYGMTGGQMAPTTLPGQRTTTSPLGRDVELTGYPIRVAELLSTLRTPSYIARTQVANPQGIIQTRKYIKKAFTYQKNNVCYSLVEILSTCPTNWGMTPLQACEWLEENMIPYFPLKEFKFPEDNGEEHSS